MGFYAVDPAKWRRCEQFLHFSSAAASYGELAAALPPAGKYSSDRGRGALPVRDDADRRHHVPIFEAHRLLTSSGSLASPG
jgi:hypothetical protein